MVCPRPVKITWDSMGANLTWLHTKCTYHMYIPYISYIPYIVTYYRFYCTCGLLIVEEMCDR